MSKKRTKYEKRIMLNLYVISILCVIATLLNFILPIVDKPKFTIFILSQFFAIGFIYVYGWVNSRNMQGIPIAATFIIRTLQALIFVFWRGDMSWTSFGVLVFLDLLLTILLVIDKSNYKYEYVVREDDEFFDS